MEILVIDGQGGGIGKSIVETLKRELPECFVIAVGTNSTASHNMKKAGADAVATGENAVVYNAQNADVIVGPIGIVFGNSMYGEISPIMAQAVSCSQAQKYLIPVTQCSGHVLGVESKSIQGYIQDFIKEFK
jgi:uncharacterized membrane protein